MTFVISGNLQKTFSQNHADRFLVDGNVSDFRDVPYHSYVDTVFKTDSGINLQSVYMAHDDENFYLGFTSERSLNLTGGSPRKGQIYIYLDLDNNRKTGYLTGALGADITIDFTRKVVRWNKQPTADLKLDQAGIRVMPTASKKTYEVAIDREIPIETKDTALLDKTIQWQLADQRSDETLPGYDTAFQYSFEGQTVPPFKGTTLTPHSSTDLRLISHNTYNNGLISDKRAPTLKRIYEVLRPDVLTLNECWDISAKRAKRFFNQKLPINNSREWHAIKLDEGNITIAKYPFKNQWLLEKDMRMSAAMVDHPVRDFLLINAHLSCCDKEQERQNQAKALMNFLEDAHTPGGRLNISKTTPIIVAGDMNLVGSGRTLKLLTGDSTRSKFFKPDWDYTPLQVLSTPHTHGHFTYTWQSLESGWPAGKLDYIMYTSSVLSPKKGFTLNTNQIPDSLLSKTKLKSKATSTASDHYPLVADFSFDPYQSSRIGKKLPYRLRQDTYHFRFAENIREVAIYNANGKMIQQYKPKKSLNLNLRSWETGRYYARFKGTKGSEVQAFFIGP